MSFIWQGVGLYYFAAVQRWGNVPEFRRVHSGVRCISGAIHFSARRQPDGIVVAGGQDRGSSLTQLSHPMGVIVDHLDNVYVADSWNNRIMCWSKGSKEGQIIVGGNEKGEQPNQFFFPIDLSFDRQGNLYVADCGNNRVQKFDIDLN